MIYKALDEYSKRDLNPHSHYWPKDFKSFVSTIPPFEHPQKRRAENETRTHDPILWQGYALPTELFPQVSGERVQR